MDDLQDRLDHFLMVLLLDLLLSSGDLGSSSYATMTRPPCLASKVKRLLDAKRE